MLRLGIVELVRALLKQTAHTLWVLSAWTTEVHVTRLALILTVQVVDALFVLSLVHELGESTAFDALVFLAFTLGHQLIAFDCHYNRPLTYYVYILRGLPRVSS